MESHRTQLHLFLASAVALLVASQTIAPASAQGIPIDPLPAYGQLNAVAPPPPSQPAGDTNLQPLLSYDEVFAPSWYTTDYWFGPEPWDKSIELGFNGSAGTSESTSIRAGGYIKRKTDRNKIDLQLLYNQTSSQGTQTQNNAQFDWRHDMLFTDSPWTIFNSVSVFYDEFQAFDLRFAINGGVGYQFIDNEVTNWIGRFGAGTSREYGGPDDRWVPEGVFGSDFTHHLSERQKFYAKVDYYPDWVNFSNYRLVTDVGWELVIDAEMNLSLKVSAIDRYDSTPNGADPNSLNYAVLLLWKL